MFLKGQACIKRLFSDLCLRFQVLYVIKVHRVPKCLLFFYFKEFSVRNGKRGIRRECGILGPSAFGGTRAGATLPVAPARAWGMPAGPSL